MFTQDGYIKRSDMSEFVINKPVVDALGLHDFDRLVAVQPNYNMAGVLMVTKLGMALNFEYASVPKQKRQGSGVIGMSLNEGDKVIFASQVNLGDKVLVVTDTSSAKRVSLTEFPISARNRKGLKLTSGAEQVVFAVSPVVTGEVVVTDNKGNLNVTDVNDVPVTARTGTGKPIIKQKSLQKVKNVSIYIA